MFWSVVLVLVLVFVAWDVLGDQNPLDVVPGPPRRPIFGCVLGHMMMSPRTLFLKLREYAEKYEDRYVLKLFRRRVVYIYNPSDIEVVLSHSKNIDKARPYKFLIPWLGTGLLISTGSKWFTRRKILTPTFHFNILKNFATVIEEKSRNLVSRLKQHQNEVDVFSVISDFTLDTICETAMGIQLDHDKSKATVEYKSAIHEIGRLIMERLTRFWLHNDFVYMMLPVGQQFNKALNKVLSFADNVISERKKQKITGENSIAIDEDNFGKKRRVALLDLLLEVESKGEINLEGIREEVNTFMFEGHDTTATALTFGLMLIADHNEVQEQIYEECQRIFGDSDRIASMADLAEMKYLEAVLKETLRLYPSVPYMGRETTEDFMMGDIFVKRGSGIGIHSYDLHRREDLFPEPEKFKPERFLNDESRHPYAYIPFSAGPRNCIGQRFAMQEMKCVLSEICRNFKLEPKQKGWRPQLVLNLVLRSIDPIYVKFVPR
ncbi:cytochrome P450 4C1-like [Hyposmocoma kahamanoa]|uniref:cytochrome P450 4C1-like n=1 Tax=Hyposmocoma kahamanoa TaxID=1477025 RepID=UPI000E6D8350|nr:cytochrome P450 4C1-like [Hyposmocoma kahamanoa]